VGNRSAPDDDVKQAVTSRLQTLHTDLFFTLLLLWDHFLNVVFFLLCDSPKSVLYMQTFRNALFHLHGRCKQEV